MSIGTAFQLALNLLKLANWIIRRFEASRWEAAGYSKALSDAAVEVDVSVGWAQAALKAAKKKTDEELDSRLGDDK